MKFAIQTVYGEIVHDFAFHLIKAIEFERWKNNDDFDYLTVDEKDLFNISPHRIVPVGSVEFVTLFLQRFNAGKTPKPKNIPESLFQFADRNIFNGTKSIVMEGDFVKSNDVIKSTYNGVMVDNPLEILPDGNYQVSDYVEFKSEWRAFVFKHKLVGLQNYLGDFTRFPDVDEIYEMIDIYKENDAPVAYTLDVGIMGQRNKTVIIEVHDFFSVGLYGFADYSILPAMFSQWYFEFTSKD